METKMEKIYMVILEDVNTGDGIEISINGCGLPMVKYHAEQYCKANRIKIVSKRPHDNYRQPVNRRQVVWTCRMPIVNGRFY